MAPDSDDLRLAVLSALVRRYGPLPCVSIVIERTRQLARAYGGARLSGDYRIEASELVFRRDYLVVQPAEPEVRLPEPTGFSARSAATGQLLTICRVLLRVPLTRVPIGGQLPAQEADQILRSITVEDGTLRVLPITQVEGARDGGQ